MGKVIVLATPVFLALVALEWAWGRRRGRDTYRLADAVSSIGLGMMSQFTAVFTRLLRVGVYAAAWGALSLVPHEAASAFWTTPWGAVLALLFYDLCYYAHHRASHECAILWAAHVVHHQSEDYNLSTALRQTSSGALLGWVFYLPMAVAGVPPALFATVALIDLLYQFWVHTEHVPKLGAFDRWFVSPSNHRVHHAVNDGYLDRNYGGILIVWDRLFGTYRDEDERCVYGTRKPLRSWDPLWANAEVYATLLRDAWRTRRWADKLRVLVGRPGWRPDDLAGPGDAVAAGARQRFDVAVPRSAQAVAAAAFVVALGLVTVFLWTADAASAPVRAVGVAALAAWLWLVGALLQARLPVALAAAGFAAIAATVGSAYVSLGVPGIDWLALHRACKPLVLVLVLAWVLRAPAPGGAASPRGALVLALAASLAGDVALMLPGGFVPGLASFAVAHAAYLRVMSHGVGLVPRPAALAATGAFGAVMLAVLWPHLPAGLHAPVAVYVGLIVLMGAQAAGRALVLRDPPAAVVAAGALLFMLSDAVLALDRFVAPVPLAPLWVLSTYFAAQIAIVRGLIDIR